MTTVVVSAIRTPFGRFGGAMKDVPAVEMGAWAIRAALSRAPLALDARDQVILGHCVGGGVGQVPGRQAALRAGLPEAVGATTLNTACTSALNAAIWGDLLIQTGRARAVIAGGMESMSQSPYILPRARWGYRLGDGPLVDDLTASLTCPLRGKHMGDYANDAAMANGITRAMQDEWAARSHRRYFQAKVAGKFADEIAPVTVKAGKTETVVSADEQPRADSTLEKLASLPPAFSPEGTVTAGNAPGLNDGAAAMILMDETDARDLGLEPLAYILGAAQVWDEPHRISTVPAETAKRLLGEQGLRVADIDLWEINEAFAAVPLICIRELGIDPERVNVNGGAVAIGHPVGATGARVLMTLVYELRRNGRRLGVATLCGAGANGAAVLVSIAPVRMAFAVPDLVSEAAA
jgi:acetyl-CoA C-acetyltransferase